MRVPAIPSLSSAALHTMRCCKHCYEWSLLLSSRAVPLSCSHTGHPSWAEGGWCVPGTSTNPSQAMIQAHYPRLLWLGRIQPSSQLPFGFVTLAHFTMVKQEEKLSVTRPASAKLLCLFNKMSLVFIFHTTESCISIHTNWNVSRKVGQIKKSVKISFLFQIVFPRYLLGYIIQVSLQLYSWKGK